MSILVLSINISHYRVSINCAIAAEYQLHYWFFHIMGDLFNFNNLLLDDIDSIIPIALNLSTPSIETSQATKNPPTISEIEHCTVRKIIQNNFGQC